jgi:hypothetical protein
MEPTVKVIPAVSQAAGRNSRAARAVGYSWGEIGQLAGVPRQLLHRRFRDEVD